MYLCIRLFSKANNIFVKRNEEYKEKVSVYKIVYQIK